MAYLNTTSAPQTYFAAIAKSILHSLEQRYTAHRVYRATVTELQALTDRDLADLGIPRSHIRRRALEAAHKAKSAL